MFIQITAVGNLVRDFELRCTNSGTPIGSNTVATSHKYKANDGSTKDEVCFLDFSIFGEMANIANQYLKKGSKVFLQGRLVQNNWTDKDGKNRTNHSMIVETIKFLDSKPSDSANAQENVVAQTQQPAPQQTMAQQQPSQPAPQQNVEQQATAIPQDAGFPF